MSRKSSIVFSCTECGAQANKWLGRCPDCNAWNSYAQEDPPAGVARAGSLTTTSSVPIGHVESDNAPRISTNVAGLDRVLGGGLVLGGVTLVGGEPGIGKSTLLLQVAEQLAKHGTVL